MIHIGVEEEEWGGCYYSLSSVSNLVGVVNNLHGLVSSIKLT